jgi:hypothetical protein
MIPKPTLESCIYALIITLSLIVLAMATVSPPNFTDNKSVYQGF